MISAMPSTEQMEDSFTMVTTSLARAGRTFLMAWGSTTRRMDCQEDRPRERAASVCPLSTASIPARNISATYAELFSAKATTPGIKRLMAMKPNNSVRGRLM